MLTKKQKDLLLFIHMHLQKTGVAPSYEEMKDALELKSKSGIHRLISGLEERGFLQRLPHRARALEVVRLPEDYKQDNSQERQTNVTEFKRPQKSDVVFEDINPVYGARVQTIPLCGKIAAGTPIEAIQDVGQGIDIPSSVLGNGEYYALTIEGDSMINAGIHDHDTVIVERCDTARDGEIIVALVDDSEATLKRLRREGDKIALIPENPAHDIRILDAHRVKIQGRLVSLYRQYH